MKRHFAPAPAIPAAPLNLSLEELAILEDEQHEVERAADTQATEIERMGDIISIMGDVKAVVSNIPEIKPIDQALVAATADMAVAGTDANPEELAGSVLPDDGVSTESLMDKIKSRHAALKNSIEK